MAAVSNASRPPPYSSVARPQRPTPEITILVLGSPGVGKSTFLSALPRVRDGRLQNADSNLPRSKHGVYVPAPNPSSFSVSLFNRPYSIIIHRSESTLFVDPFPNKVDFVIFCYAVDSRESLYNCQFYWRKQFAERYEKEQGLTVPVMLIGLKRDLRTDEMRTVDGIANVADIGGREVGAQTAESYQQTYIEKREEYVCVLPQEGLRAAQEMRCDKYCECSAVTGELMWEVLEDITRTAALTTTDNGGFSESSCTIM